MTMFFVCLTLRTVQKRMLILKERV